VQLLDSVKSLSSMLGDSSQSSFCLLCLGWGGGLLSKAAARTDGAEYRAVLRNYSFYQRALQTGMPFPKTRRIVFQEGHPSCLPGWVKLETLGQ
jgi:CRISPR-associated protein Csm5